MRRTIKDLDQDLAQVKASIENINDAVGSIVGLLKDKEVKDEEEVKYEMTPLEKAHEAEFGHYKTVSIEAQNSEPEHYELPSFEVGKVVHDWVNACAKYHGRSTTEEMQLMIKKLYFASKAETDAALSRVNNE